MSQRSKPKSFSLSDFDQEPLMGELNYQKRF